MVKKSIQNLSSRVKNFGLITSCLLIPTMTMAQDKSYQVKKVTKSDDIRSFDVNDGDGKISAIYVKKGKKNEIYTNYVFDKHLNLITETEEELDVEQVKKKKTQFGSSWGYITGYGSMGGIIRDSVLSVENNMLGQLVLMTGYIGWTSKRNPMNGADITDQGFVAREKIRVKDDATKRKLTMVGYQTDAPAEFFATGRALARAGTPFATGSRKGFEAQKQVSSSTGDVMVVSTINTIGLKDEATGEKIFGNNFRFVAQRYSAKTLEKIAETPFEYKYSYKKLYDQPATDDSNDMLLIFAPTHGGVKPYFAPDKNEYEYIRVGVDTKIKERVKFNSPYGRLNNLYIYNLGDETVILGTSKTGNESKYADFVPFKGNDDHLVTIRLKNGQAPVVKATPIKDLGIELSRFAGSDALKNSENQIWITGQEFTQKDADPAKWGKIHAFNIETDGRVAKLLTLHQIEKTSERVPSPISLVKLDANGEHLLWNAYEITKKGNMYPKYAKINSQDLGAVVFPGNKQYVVNDKFPMYISPDKKELIYFGNTEDEKQLWLHKQGL